MAVTLAEAQADLALWETAIAAILGGAQEYEIGGFGGRGRRVLKRADLAEVRKGRDDARRLVASLERGGGVRVVRVVPRDV